MDKDEKVQIQEEPKVKKIEKQTFNTVILSIGISLAIVSVQFTQLLLNGKSMKADFAHKIKTDFFTDEERTLMLLLNNDLLEFRIFKDSISKIEFSYFALNCKKAKYFQNDTINLLTKAKITYSTLEIEDILLNHFEDLNMYRKHKIIANDYLYNGFSGYFDYVYKNVQIQKLIAWLKTDIGGNDSYAGLTELYDFFKNFKPEGTKTTQPVN
jgi:hypothetical protein